MDVSNPGKVMFPEPGYTKADLVAHYRVVASRLVQHAAGRPLTLHRFPNGIAAKGFLQKNAGAHFPPSIGRVEVPKRDGVTRYPVIEDEDAVAYLANQGTITFHAWTSRLPDLNQPDRLVFDLDPPQGGEAAAATAARAVRDLLTDLGLDSAPMTTGSKGYHVVAPIVPSVPFDRVARCCQAVAAVLAADDPDRLTTEFKIAKRAGRVFVDWLRNTSRATGVVAYSLRARPGAPVAVPFDWHDLDETAPQHWGLATVRSAMDRPDPILALDPAAPEAPFAALDALVERREITLERFDRFRS